MNTKLFTFDKTIYAGDKKYLKDIIKDNDYKEWFSLSNKPNIYVLNKGICGNGGTTGFINYAKRNSKGLYIMVPNRSIAMSKEFDKDICCVYGGATGTDENKPVKVATWDSGLNIITYYQEWGLAGEDVFDNKVWKNSLLVIDEYHKIVEDSSYREVCSKILETVINTKLNVVLMSATPDYELVSMLKEVSDKEVITINVEYNESKEAYKPIYCMFNYRKRDKDGKLSDKTTIKNILHKTIEANAGKQIAVFYNNVKELNSIIDKSLHKDDIELLCSKDNKDDVFNYSERFNSDKNVHFMSSSYFTGMDINVYIDVVVIIGGNGTTETALTNKSIKQIEGRMRQGYGDIYVIKDSMPMNTSKLGLHAAEKEKAAKYWDNFTDKTESFFLQFWLDWAYNKQSIEAMNAWQCLSDFKEYMSVFCEYSLKEDKMTLIEANPDTRKTTTFNQYKRKRLENIKMEFKFANMCDKFIDVKGIEKFKRASLNEIKSWYKNFRKSDGADVCSLSEDELWNMFLGNGIYSDTYLRNLLEYIGATQTDNLCVDISNTFGCVCGFWDGRLDQKNRGNYMVVKVGSEINVTKSGSFKSSSLIEKVSTFCQKNLCQKNLYALTVSKRYSYIEVKKHKWSTTNSHSITTDLFTTDITSLQEIHKGFDTLVIDNTNQIADVKSDERMSKQFSQWKESQTMISEFYKSNCNNRYRHTKDECDTISSVMVDIDGSIRFSEFKEVYKDVHFIAYPSISNTDSGDWKKYRVIFPLYNSVNIPNGEHNLKVLKFLRNFICKWEDQQHQLGSYINKEQWDMRYTNEGNSVNISQDFVDYVSTIVNSIKDCKSLRINKFGKMKGGDWTIDEAITEWENVENQFKGNDSDGVRHTTTFKIKANLDEDNRKMFREWLKENYPNAIKHWDSHKC